MREGFGGEKNEVEKASHISAELMECLSKKENELLGEPILDGDGRLNMRSFQISHGGHLHKEDIKAHEGFIREKELEWSGLDDEKVRAFFCEKYGIKTSGRTPDEIDRDLLAQWNERKKEKDGELAESVITSLFARNVGERFLAVRSSKYDDYAHGVDQLIIDRTTGDVICAFDEVVDASLGSRRGKKYDKVLRTARRGGTSVTYGISFEKNNLIRQEINGLPVFSLPIAKHELTLVLHDMAEHPDTQSDEERVMMESLLDSLMEQVEMLSVEKLNPRVAKNVQNVRSALQSMMSIRSQNNLQKAA